MNRTPYGDKKHEWFAERPLLGGELFLGHGDGWRVSALARGATPPRR